MSTEAVFILILLTIAVSFTLGFSTERLQSDEEHQPVTTATHVTADQIDDVIGSKDVKEILELAYDTLQNERNAIEELYASVKHKSIQELGRLREVSDLIENYMDETKDGYGAQNKRKHRKRSTFDSISHNGGLGRLGHSESASGRRGKLAFTFQNLLPYLLNEQRRNNRAVRMRRYQ